MRDTLKGLATPTDVTLPDTPPGKVDIFEFVKSFEEDALEMLLNYGHDDYQDRLDGFALELLVWRGDTVAGYPGRNPGRIVEWLITYGGPTVRLQYDNRYNYGELYHSWGFNPFTGRDQTSIEVSGDLVADLASAFCAE